MKKWLHSFKKPTTWLLFTLFILILIVTILDSSDQYIVLMENVSNILKTIFSFILFVLSIVFFSLNMEAEHYFITMSSEGKKYQKKSYQKALVVTIIYLLFQITNYETRNFNFIFYRNYLLFSTIAIAITFLPDVNITFIAYLMRKKKKNYLKLDTTSEIFFVMHKIISWTLLFSIVLSQILCCFAVFSSMQMLLMSLIIVPLLASYFVKKNPNIVNKLNMFITVSIIFLTIVSILLFYVGFNFSLKYYSEYVKYPWDIDFMFATLGSRINETNRFNFIIQFLAGSSFSFISLCLFTTGLLFCLCKQEIDKENSIILFILLSILCFVVYVPYLNVTFNSLPLYLDWLNSIPFVSFFIFIISAHFINKSKNNVEGVINV